MSEELKSCPFCEINDWQYHAHFSGATIRQCGGCGTIIDESIINTRPIEDALIARIAELEALIERLIDIGDWATVGMVISNSYSPNAMRELAEKRLDKWKTLVRDWKHSKQEGVKE